MTAEQVAPIVALAGEEPPLSGRPITRWTLDELRDEALKRKIVPTISRAQIGRYRQRAAVQPQRCKMWLNTTEKDAEKFQCEVEAVCQTYLEAPAKAQTNGTQTVSVDEATSLQALERPAANKPAQPGQVAKQEYEYLRHGTTTLTAGLDVVTGQIVSPTLEATRTEPEFVEHIARTVLFADTVQLDDTAEWIFVVDHLNTHQSASLVEWVARKCGVSDTLGKKVEGILKSQATRREFLADASHRIRFVDLPKHSSWLNPIEIIFGIIPRQCLRGGRFTAVPALNDQLTPFIGDYNQTMAHPFHWTYTGKPLDKPKRATFTPHHHQRVKLNQQTKLAA